VVIGAVLGVAAYFITFRIFITIRRRARQADTDSRPRP